MARRRHDRWLSLAQVAELMGLKHKDPNDRRRYVWRLLTALEARDGRKYTKRFGPGRGKLWVAVSTVERLMPWDPGTIARMRGDVDELGTRMKRAEKKIVSHDQQLVKHREWQAKVMQLMTEMPGPTVP